MKRPGPVCRPFILEITNPVHRFVNLDELQKNINQAVSGKVEVSNLELSNHRAVRDLKAAKPGKTYGVKVKFSNKVDIEKLKEVICAFSGKVIQQRTPVRVSHRRADLVRERSVITMELSEVSGGGLEADITIIGESGLYIKELITGDSGRTQPSLTSELGLECSVQELDVLKINDDQL